MSLEITSTYVLHKLSEEFMAARVLYYGIEFILHGKTSADK